MFMNLNNISIAFKITTHMKYMLICVIKCTVVLSFILFKLRETHPFEANYNWYLKEDEFEMILETWQIHITRKCSIICKLFKSQGQYKPNEAA